jgi:hypothetical protein
MNFYECRDPISFGCEDFSSDINTCKIASTHECSLISSDICKNTYDNTCNNIAS